jgi:chromosome partitioning protein
MGIKIISMTSIKGGAGKTSLAVHAALSLAKKGHRVLFIDLDHNNNATDFFLRDTDTAALETRNVKEVFLDRCGIEDAVWPVSKGDIALDVIPATPALWTIGQELAADPMALHRFIARVRSLDYEYVMFDTPPARCFELQAALYSADLFLVPVSPNRWIIQNYTLVAGELRKVEQATGRIPVIKVVPYMVSPAAREFIESAGIWQSVAAAFPRDVAVQNSTDSGRPLKAGSRTEGLFSALAGEIASMK